MSFVRSSRARRRVLAAALAVGAVVALTIAPTAEAGPKSGTTPVRVEGPVPGTPNGAAPYDVGGAGYVEQEFFFSGNAQTYTTPVRTAPYRMRMLVYRPVSPKNFSGTAILEWENVTGQVSAHPMFSWLHSYAIPRGHIFVLVAAQATPAAGGLVGQGQLGFVAQNPQRYASLAHPGDDFSFDIYTQAMRALTSYTGASPAGPLKVRREIAVGNSQSAIRLHTYVNDVQPSAEVADAVLLDAGGAKSFPRPPSVPVIQLLSEDGFTAAQPNQTTNYRLWEVAGASHNDADETRHRSKPGDPRQTWAEHLQADRTRHYGEQGVSQHATCIFGVGGNEYPRRYAVAAAVEALERWIVHGTPAPSPPRVSYDANGRPVRDTHGNVVGGLRLPPIDVPVARYAGDACLLFGLNVPLLPPVLDELYPTHASYVARMQAATDRAVAAGFLLPSDAAELMTMARLSAIGADRR